MTDTSGATPPRTFRLSDEAMAILDDATKTFGGATRSETLRRILDATAAARMPSGDTMRALAAAIQDGPGAKAAMAELRAALPAFEEGSPAAKAVREQVQDVMRVAPLPDPVRVAQRRLVDAVTSTVPDILRAERRRVVAEALKILRDAETDEALIDRVAGLAG